MHTKKLIYQQVNTILNSSKQDTPLIDIRYINNITQDFLNNSKPRQIKNFIMEMNPIYIRTTLHAANDKQLEKIVKAIYGDRKLINKIKKSFS